VQVEVARRQIEDAAWDQHGSVVHQNVDAAEGVECALDQRGDLLFIGHVGLDRQRPSPQGFDFLSGFVNRAGEAGIGLAFRASRDHDIGPFGRKGQGDVFANPA
jgi:hypothetical protein